MKPFCRTSPPDLPLLLTIVSVLQVLWTQSNINRIFTMQIVLPKLPMKLMGFGVGGRRKKILCNAMHSLEYKIKVNEPLQHVLSCCD